MTTYLLSQTARIAKQEVDRRLGERGMRLRHMAVLACVAEGPYTQLEVGNRLALDPSDVTATVDDLEGAGFVVRSTDAADRRRKLVSVTAAGRRELARLRRMADRISDELLAPLSVRHRKQLHDDLVKVLRAHAERGDAASAGRARR